MNFGSTPTILPPRATAPSASAHRADRTAAIDDRERAREQAARRRATS
jgi:hypothetical protein